MKMLMTFMYKGEVSCRELNLVGLLKTAEVLQIRALRGIEQKTKKREAEGLFFSPPLAHVRFHKGSIKYS